jgi:hypothetical protein
MMPGRKPTVHRAISPHPNFVTAESVAQIEAAMARLAEEQGRAKERDEVTVAANPGRELRYWSATRPTAELKEPKTSSRPGDVVLDPFLGSGSTAIVAKKFGRLSTGPASIVPVR